MGGGREGGKEVLLPASCSFRPKGRGLDIAANSQREGRREELHGFLEEGKNQVRLPKGGKEGKRKTKRGKERRGREGRSAVARKDSYRETQDKESKERSRERKRRRGRKRKRRKDFNLPPLLLDLWRRGKRRRRGVGRQRALPPRVYHGHVSTGAELKKEELASTHISEGGEGFLAYIPVVLRDLKLLNAFRLNKKDAEKSLNLICNTHSRNMSGQVALHSPPHRVLTPHDVAVEQEGARDIGGYPDNPPCSSCHRNRVTTERVRQVVLKSRRFSVSGSRSVSSNRYSRAVNNRNKLGRDHARSAREDIHRTVVQVERVVGTGDVLNDEIDDFEAGIDDSCTHRRDRLAALDSLQEGAAKGKRGERGSMLS